MADRCLNKEELLVLQQYIRSRSATFAEPAIMLELLDHFACKVEATLAENGKLSLEEAMKQAHQSFGIKGFASLAEGFKILTIHKYKKYFTTLLHKKLCSLHTIGLLAVALLVGKVQFYLQISGMDGWTSTLRMLVMVVYAMGIFPYHRRLGRNKFASLYYEAALIAGAGQFIWFVMAQFVLIGGGAVLPVFWSSALLGIVVFGSGLHLLVYQELMKQVACDSEETAQTWQQASS